MKIKKYIMKTMCSVLTCTAIMGNAMVAFASEAIVTESPIEGNIGGGRN